MVKMTFVQIVPIQLLEHMCTLQHVCSNIECEM